jgi:RND family efflux transporter MFP subunit
VGGGFFLKGDLLFMIEAEDYRLAVERAEAAKAKAEYELARVESNARIAREEWERIAEDKSEPNPLVVHEPQLKNARASLASASAALKQAQLHLERTKVYAPFNCRVRSEQIAEGQFVSAGRSVAVLSASDTAEIIVPLPLEELVWLDIPRVGARRGSKATVNVSVGGRTFKWQGQVVRSLGEVDPKSHMARVVVAVDDPYGLDRNSGRPELKVGTFVEVQLHGSTLKGIIAIPRYAFRENSTVWIIDEESRLRIIKVAPVRMKQNEVLIKEGLNEGDTVVITTLSGAADGMKLRTVKKEETP